jgi:hypothetical protein
VIEGGNRGGRHQWLRAALLARGYSYAVASAIATRYLRGETLFPNELQDALACDPHLTGATVLTTKELQQ